MFLATLLRGVARILKSVEEAPKRKAERESARQVRRIRVI